MKATILVVDDDAALRRFLSDRLKSLGHHVETAEDGKTALEVSRNSRFDLVLLDLAMPGLTGFDVIDELRKRAGGEQIVVLTAHGSVDKVVDAMKRGADDFLTKPADLKLLENILERVLEQSRLRRVSRAQADRRDGLVLGPSKAMAELVETIDRAAQSDATILLTGESGTGKQVFAEALHARSLRAQGPFVYVNCVAIAETLIESTLFGHEPEAFTDARKRKEGRLEAAAGGTAFLDEIGDITPALQAKLLHFLETGEFERVGGTQTLRVDCRIVAATNRDLAKDVEDGRFRQDLFYRLNVVTLVIPPLRERPEDVPALAHAFVDRYAAETKRGELELPEETVDALRRFDWPGNVRQLKNAIERMVVLARDPRLDPELLPPEVVGTRAERESEEDGESLWKSSLADAKRKILREALARHGGNQTRTAKYLGLQRSYLNRLLKDLGVD